MKKCYDCGKRLWFGKNGYHYRCRRRMIRRQKEIGRQAGRWLPPRKNPPYIP